MLAASLFLLRHTPTLPHERANCIAVQSTLLRLISSTSDHLNSAPGFCSFQEIFHFLCRHGRLAYFQTQAAIVWFLPTFFSSFDILLTAIIPPGPQLILPSLCLPSSSRQLERLAASVSHPPKSRPSCGSVVPNLIKTLRTLLQADRT